MKSNPWGASFLTFSGTVLFIGIILVLANAVRERPVYADEPVKVQAAVVPVVEPALVPVALPAPVTVVERVVEKVVERIVYVPTPANPTPKVSVSRTRCCQSFDCTGNQQGSYPRWGASISERECRELQCYKYDCSRK